MSVTHCAADRCCATYTICIDFLKKKTWHSVLISCFHFVSIHLLFRSHLIYAFVWLLIGRKQKTKSFNRSSIVGNNLNFSTIYGLFRSFKIALWRVPKFNTWTQRLKDLKKCIYYLTNKKEIGEKRSSELHREKNNPIYKWFVTAHIFAYNVFCCCCCCAFVVHITNVDVLICLFKVR